MGVTRRKRGEGGITGNGYRIFGFDRGERQLEHILIAERILGKRLKPGQEVHHINGNKLDNRPENLVLCQDRAFHMLLHQRQRAYDECGHANWLRCSYCKTYDDPKNMKFRPRGRDRPGQVQWTHPQCARDYANSRKRRAA